MQIKSVHMKRKVRLFILCALNLQKGVLYLKSSLKNQHVVITGASGGLGEHLAYEVAKRGASPFYLHVQKKSCSE